MKNAEKFIQRIKVGKLTSGLENGEITAAEKMGAVQDYSTKQQEKDLEAFRFYMNTSDYDQEKNVKVPVYMGDKEK